MAQLLISSQSSGKTLRTLLPRGHSRKAVLAKVGSGDPSEGLRSWLPDICHPDPFGKAQDRVHEGSR